MFYSKVAALIGVIAAPAIAAPADEASDGVLAPFAACRALPDPAQRGLCYDRAYEGVRGRLAAGDVVISDAAHRQAAFGLRNPPAQRSRAAKAATPVPIGIDQIETTIVGTRPYGPDMYLFQFADGGVWRTAESERDPRYPNGTKVRLKRTAFGGILLQPEHGREVKVVRVR